VDIRRRNEGNAMARDRSTHLHFGNRPAPLVDPRQAELQERQRRLERSLAVPPGRRGLDFATYRDLSDQAAQNVCASAMVGQITGRIPGDLKKIQQRIEYHETQGTLRAYVLQHPDEIVAVLCGNTKRSLSMLISALDGPRDAYLQTLKNLLIADLKPSSRGGEYLDLYNAITELMCASFNYLAACAPQAPASPVTQSDLCKQVRVRAEKFYGVLQEILANGSEFEEVRREGVITEATMQQLRQGQERERIV
jgi:hypothetical protein